MLAYQDGDSKAFEVLYDRVADRLYGYLRRRLSSPELVDDVFQNTFSKLHQVRLQYRPPLPVLPWLFTICRTVLIDSVRVQERRRENLDDMSAFSAVEERGNHEQVRSSDLLDGLAGRKTLPAAQRQALELRFQDDLSFEQIAERLKTSPANARQLISRGVQRLRSFVKKERDGT